MILRPARAAMGSGWGCASYASLTLDVAMLYSPSVPWPSWPYWGKPAVNSLPSSPQIHAVNSAPHATAWRRDHRALHGHEAVIVLLGFGPGAMEPTPSWPCLLAPHAYALPAAVTTTV